MSVLWRWVIQRRLLEERLRTALTVLGVALGVAMFVSIRLASRSALDSFAETVDAVAGRANLQVVSRSDAFDERLYPAIRSAPGVRAAAPVVEIHARARPGAWRADPASGDRRRDWPETLLILGLDPLSERPFARYRAPDAGEARAAGLALLTDPRAVAITRTLARRHDLAPGDTLTVLASGRPEPLVVRQVLESQELQHAAGGNVAIVDIATAQEVFRRFGRIDRVDLRVAPARRDSIRAALERMLPPAVAVELPQGRTRQVENMVRAFDLNLTALSFIAVFVAVFLIFNAVAMSVLRWRAEIGMLRALGVTRRAVAALFLGEGLCLGIAGGVLGLALGTLLARGTLAAVSRTLTDLYLVRAAARIRPDLEVYATGLGIGIAVALLSALAPALEAARTPPGVTMRQGVLIEIRRMQIGRWTAAGIALLVAAALAAWWTVAAGRPQGGFLSAFLALAGFSALAPAFTLLCGQLAGTVRRLLGIEGALGIRYLREAVARTSVAVAALMVSVGMLVALTVMVTSFRRTVDTWITQTIRGDLYIEPVGHHESVAATALPERLVEDARRLPGVVAVDSYRGTRISHGGRIAFLAGVDFDVQRRFGRLLFLRGESSAILGRALARDGAVVSESFAHHHRVGAGDTLALATPAGRAAVPVIGVYHDYTTDAGAVLIDRRLFARLWRDPRTESLALYLAPGTEVDRARRDFLALAGPDLVLSITPNQALRARILRVFDQTFQITWALQGIAVLVAVLGVIGTLTALILQRGREIGVLRAIGALRSQVRKMVVIESVLIGLAGALLGCIAGVGLAAILVHVINRQFFGWTIQMTIEPGVFVQAVSLMTVTAAIAGLAPARLAATRVAAEAMRAE